MKIETSSLWEVLVPAEDELGEIPVSYHQAWDEVVRKQTGGLTITPAAKGQWVDEGGELFKEKMIPVRIACGEDDMRMIMEFTLRYYGQTAVLASLISEKTMILTADEFGAGSVAPTS